MMTNISVLNKWDISGGWPHLDVLGFLFHWVVVSLSSQAVLRRWRTLHLLLSLSSVQIGLAFYKWTHREKQLRGKMGILKPEAALAARILGDFTIWVGPWAGGILPWWNWLVKSTLGIWSLSRWLTRPNLILWQQATYYRKWGKGSLNCFQKLDV